MTTLKPRRFWLAAFPGCVPTALAVLAVLLIAAGAGCSTARQREEPTGPLSLLRFRDAQTAAYFAHVYRTGNLYVDFRPVLIVDAIVEDRAYREHFVNMLAERYLLSPEAVAASRKGQESQFESHVDILLFVYEGSNEPSTLAKKDSLWQIFLRDDDEQLFRPERIEKIAPDGTTFAYLQKYFEGLDRWSQAYRVRFPKLSKGVLGQPIGSHPFELIITGVKGTVKLSWADPTIFYRGGGESG
jgi:hypothetical protein